MMDCKEFNMEKKKNEVSKPAPLPSNNVTNPNQLWTRGTWQSKRTFLLTSDLWSKVTKMAMLIF